MTGSAEQANRTAIRAGARYVTEIRIGQPAGCAAGVIMPDGTVVRVEGEPPVVHGGNWFRSASEN